MRFSATIAFICLAFTLSAQISPDQLEFSPKSYHADSIRVLGAFDQSTGEYFHHSLALPSSLVKYLTVTGDTSIQDIQLGSDTIRRTFFKIIQSGDVITSPNTDDQIISNFSVSGDTLSISIEDGNTKKVILTGISGEFKEESRVITTDTMIISMGLPLDASQWTVHDGPVELIESGTTPSHPIQFQLITSNTIKLYEPPNSTITVRRYN